jgi:hypothetical protein
MSTSKLYLYSLTTSSASPKIAESEVSAFFLAGRMPADENRFFGRQASRGLSTGSSRPALQVSIGKNSRSITSIQAHLRMI